VAADEIKQLRDIERLIQRRLPRIEIEGFEPNHQLPTAGPIPTKPKTKPKAKSKPKAHRRRQNQRTKPPENVNGNQLRPQAQQPDVNGNLKTFVESDDQKKPKRRFRPRRSRSS
jgi:ATP-dependent RNA helicase RhlE